MMRTCLVWVLSISLTAVLYIAFIDDSSIKQQIFASKHLLTDTTKKKKKKGKHKRKDKDKEHKHQSNEQISSMALNVAELSNDIFEDVTNMKSMDETRIIQLSHTINYTESRLKSTKTDIQKLVNTKQSIKTKQMAATRQSHTLAKVISTAESSENKHGAIKVKLDQEIKLYKKELRVIKDHYNMKVKLAKKLESQLNKLKKKKNAAKTFINALSEMEQTESEKNDFGIEHCNQNSKSCNWTNHNFLLDDAEFNQMYTFSVPPNFTFLSLSMQFDANDEECNIVVEIGVNEVCDFDLQSPAGHRICRWSKLWKNCHACDGETFDLQRLAKANHVNDTQNISMFCLIFQKEIKDTKDCNITSNVGFNKTERTKRRKHKISCSRQNHKRRIMNDYDDGTSGFHQGFTPIFMTTLCLIVGLLSFYVLFK